MARVLIDVDLICFDIWYRWHGVPHAETYRCAICVHLPVLPVIVSPEACWRGRWEATTRRPECASCFWLLSSDWAGQVQVCQVMYPSKVLRDHLPVWRIMYSDNTEGLSRTREKFWQISCPFGGSCTWVRYWAVKYRCTRFERPSTSFGRSCTRL